jgi:hypothetical protein
MSTASAVRLKRWQCYADAAEIPAKYLVSRRFAEFIHHLIKAEESQSDVWLTADLRSRG